ncbi:hypothetical protein [Companilactobacillus mishanensis]|uniref:Uncharacterized protein n=1 Tax=Companilactobacillus mishanensis TaxID=2486008 RepID=A0A5P0ZF08_9LACO|nr:hypothetical protein [Companilactobacillus mishanensis]MQS44260.1 hypothetical protein [Companilactobacillus mishanensis]MQS51637.1 hypothetical protein [Companilactobacillus mishanensis]
MIKELEVPSYIKESLAEMKDRNIAFSEFVEEILLREPDPLFADVNIFYNDSLEEAERSEFLDLVMRYFKGNIIIHEPKYYIRLGKGELGYLNFKLADRTSSLGSKDIDGVIIKTKFTKSEIIELLDERYLSFRVFPATNE